MTYNPLKILNEQFGYSSFRLHQEAIINSVLSKQDTFALMPTGGGKSLCYQVPALCFSGLTIVISPLIALMKDQVDALKLNGVSAAFLNSTQTSAEQENILALARSKKLKLLYLAPEKILGNGFSFMSTLRDLEISLIAIDEAHCISHWGHDFRPEYLMLSKLRAQLPQVPFIALTATADKVTRADIVEKLHLKEAAVYVSSFNRSNIRYTVEPKSGHFEKLLQFLESRREDSGIIYCLSRKSTEKLAQDLTECGFDALAYHAGMERQQRARHQEKFQRDDVKIIVATIAFGMGIDKSNVRYVVHMDLPKNIESYYQETGRAGRDGLPSEALLFYSSGDLIKLKKFAQIEGNDEQTTISLKKLEQMGRFGELVTCRRKYLLNYFDEDAEGQCGNCDVCLSSVEMYDATIHVQKVLSAIVRLNESYGGNFIIDFLRGSESAKITEAHRALKTYGVGADVEKDQWKKIIRELIERDYLEQSGGQYPLLKTTPRCAAVLSGAEKVMLTKSKVVNVAKVEKVNKDEIPYEEGLFNRLKDRRRELASFEEVPAYIILSDASLRELAAYLPMSLSDILNISGFGKIKVEKYGETFTKVVREYCEEHGLETRMKLKTIKRERKELPERDSDTKQITLKAFLEGKTIEEIAHSRSVILSTIEGHLAFYIERKKLDVTQVVRQEKIPAIEKVIMELGDQRLSPIKQALGEAYSYGEIKCVIAHLKTK
jgi:ATP-dependent DNA helicase RecQ